MQQPILGQQKCRGWCGTLRKATFGVEQRELELVLVLELVLELVLVLVPVPVPEPVQHN